MAAISTWSTTAASNNSASPDGWPEGMAPSGVNDSARENMSATRTWYEDAEWINWGDTTAYVGATQFKIAGADVTSRYTVNRRVRVVGTSTGTIYGRISVSAFSTDTTVTVVFDSGSMSSETLTVSLGAIQSERSLPRATGQSIAAGATVQIVNTQDGAVATGTTVLPQDDTIPQNTEGDEYMTLAITPTSSSNLLKIDMVLALANSNTNPNVLAALFQDSTAGALAGMMGGRNGATNQGALISFTHWMTAGTTSATTFKVRAGTGGAGTTTFNGLAATRLFGGVMASSMTITEIQA